MTHPQPIQRELFPRREHVPAPRVERIAAPGERLLRALRRRWLVALAAFVLTAVSVCAGVALLPPQYQAQASVEFSAPPELLHANTPDPLAVATPDDLHTLEWQFGSRASALATVDALHLDRAVSATAPRTRQAAAELLSRHLDLDPVEQSRVLVLRYRDRDPRRAAQVLNTLVAVTLQHMQQQRLRGIGQAQATLAQQLQNAQQALQAAQQNLHERAAASPEVLSGDSDGASAAADRLRALEAADTQAGIQAAHLQAELQASTASSTAGAVLPENLGADLTAQLLVRRADVEARVHRLSAQYISTALPLVQARQELASIDASLRRYRRAGLQREQQQWKASQTEQARLDAAVRRQQQRLAAQQTARLRYADLQRASAAAAHLCDELEARQQQLAVAASWSPPAARLIDAATPPAYPLHPRLALALVIALLTASILAPGVAFLVDHADGRLRLPEAAELGVPLLATTGPIDALPAEALDPVLVAIHVAARQYGSHVFLLTGARECEGESAVAAQLAQSLAETGDPVLVIDAGFHRPRVHHHAGIEPAPGLAEFLVGKHSFDECLDSVCMPGRSKHWSLMPAGAARMTTSQLILLPAMQDLLRTARTQYQWVLITSGSILSNIGTRLLLELSDAGILVASVHGRSRACTRSALHLLRLWRAPMLGLVYIGRTDRSAEYSRSERADRGCRQ